MTMPNSKTTILSWIAVIFCMAVIFYLSSQPAEQSNQLSRGITEVIVETVEKVTPDTDIDIRSFNNTIRKNAHFIAYLVLGILMINALRRSGVYGFRAYILALGICVLYAISDEVHQLFVPGRGGQMRDVVIDSAGSIGGLGMYRLMHRMGRFGRELLMESKDIRWVQRFSNYQKAFNQLKEAVKLMETRDLSNLEKQGMIQAFAYTHELAWKMLKDFLKSRGNTEIYGSKDATREAFQMGLIEDGEIWMTMIQSRNLTSHVYDESTATEMIQLISESYFKAFDKLQIKMDGLRKDEVQK